MVGPIHSSPRNRGGVFLASAEQPNRVKTDEHGYRSVNHIVWHTDICALTAMIRLNSADVELEIRLKPGAHQ